MKKPQCGKCGAWLINNCGRCGAPVCCPQCCIIDTLERKFPIGSGDMRDPVGMTLRDYFAAAALQGILASVQSDEITIGQVVAKNAYDIADAMLKERHEHKFKMVDGLPICDCGKLCPPPKTKADRSMKG